MKNVIALFLAGALAAGSLGCKREASEGVDPEPAAEEAETSAEPLPDEEPAPAEAEKAPEDAGEWVEEEDI